MINCFICVGAVAAWVVSCFLRDGFSRWMKFSLRRRGECSQAEDFESSIVEKFILIVLRNLLDFTKVFQNMLTSRNVAETWKSCCSLEVFLSWNERLEV